MAATAHSAPTAKPLLPDLYEKILAAGAVVMLAFVAAALARGHDHWHEVGPVVWAHLFTIVIALVLTPVMLLRRRGDRLHRRLGWVWGGAMLTTAAASLFIRLINHGGLSVIHILSVWTLIQVPVIVISARRHDVRRHRSAVRGMITGALLIAGFFTFPFGRMLGSWLAG